MASTTVAARLTASTRTLSTKATSALSASSQSQLVLRPSQSYAYLQFGLPRDLAGSQVLSAKLQICGTAAWGGTRTLTAQRISGPVTYSKMTWKNTLTGILEPGSTARTGGPIGTVWHEVDVTADFQLIAQGAAYYGHRLLNSEAGIFRTFYGATHPTAYPRLVLEYAKETPAPAQVSPDGVVGIAKPVFTWAASNDVTAIQAQADVVGGSFTSPSWDSGTVTSTLGHVDTNALGWAGLADTAAADFQFRQLGTLGWSVWSDPVTVTRHVYPTLSTVLPVPNDVSNDPTPQHDWVFPGQAKFQLLIVDAANKTLYDSKVVSGDDDSWTPVPGSFKVSATATLTSVLRVWDDRTDRVASVGDPGYVEARWSWTVAPSADTDPAASFSVAMLAERPAPQLTWTRPDGAPDEWIVYRDGLQVARFDGDEGQVSTTRWSWDDWTAPPNTDVVYYVAAVVSGKMSHPSPAGSVFTELSGVVVYEPTSGAFLNVAGEGAGDNLNMVESSVTYRGPYAQRSIKRVMALGGIEGEVSGFLHEYGDRPVEEQIADAETIRSYPTRTCRLMFGFRNVPVSVSNLSWAVASDATPQFMMHRVSCAVAQIGEFDTDATGLGA